MELKKEEWLLCPLCKGKTRTKLLQETILLYFPLFCPKCKKEVVINVQKFNTTIISEPDAETQSRNL